MVWPNRVSVAIMSASPNPIYLPTQPNSQVASTRGCLAHGHARKLAQGWRATEEDDVILRTAMPGVGRQASRQAPR